MTHLVHRFDNQPAPHPLLNHTIYYWKTRALSKAVKLISFSFKSDLFVWFMTILYFSFKMISCLKAHSVWSASPEYIFIWWDEVSIITTEMYCNYNIMFKSIFNHVRQLKRVAVVLNFNVWFSIMYLSACAISLLWGNHLCCFKQTTGE